MLTFEIGHPFKLKIIRIFVEEVSTKDPVNSSFSILPTEINAEISCTSGLCHYIPVLLCQMKTEWFYISKNIKASGREQWTYDGYSLLYSPDYL